MIVYTTVLRVSRGSEAGFRRAIHEWLMEKHRTGGMASIREPSGLKSGLGLRLGPKPAWLEVLDDGDDEREWTTLCIRYRHEDATDKSRTWIVVAGYRKGENGADDTISVLLRTEEMSPLVRSPLEPSRPRLVDGLLRHCAPSPSTPGLRLRELRTPDDVGRWAQALHSPGRKVPFVLVSPTEQWGDYLVDPEVLQKLLLGVAEVARVSVEANSYLVTERVGKELSAWCGAVAVYLPPTVRWEEKRGGTAFPVKRFLRDEIEKTPRPEANLVFPYVLHWANWRTAETVVRWEALVGLVAHRRLERAKRRLAEEGDQAQLAELFAQEVDRQAEEIEKVRKERDDLAEARDLALFEIDELKAQIRAKDEAFATIHAEVGQASRAEFSAELRQVLLRFAGGSPSLLDGLELVAQAYPGRLCVLETARRSASESNGLDRRVLKQALELLLKLGGPYWEQLVAGKGDAEARGLFGNDYAARESDTVISNRRAKELRTFTYRDEAIVMERHLRVGVKDSPATTWRCHFHWDSLRKKLVIGHCGKHLDFG